MCQSTTNEYKRDILEEFSYTCGPSAFERQLTDCASWAETDCVYQHNRHATRHSKERVLSHVLAGNRISSLARQDLSAKRVQPRHCVQDAGGHDERCDDRHRKPWT